MLARAHRLTSGDTYARTIRRGRKAATRTLVVHVLSEAPGLSNDQSAGPRVGFVVSKAVGNAVTRNQVKRRLRELARERLASLPEGALVAVRALPASSAASSAELGADLDRALSRALERRTVAGSPA